MNTHLKNIKIAFLVPITIMCFVSCQKIIQYPKYDIVAGSIYIKEANITDAVIYNTAVPYTDTLLTATFEAAIADQPSAYAHTITFKVDTTKLAAYISEHGNATLLPSSNYKVIKLVSNMSAGSPQSESASIQLQHTGQIQVEKNYVLPIVIVNVDDNRTDAIRSGQVLYLVFTKTPDPKNFKIASSSGDNGINLISNVLAGTTSLYWRSAVNSASPQNFVVNMGAQYPISGISYNDGPDYVTSGGNGAPKTMEIDVSNDGITFTVAGTFTGLLATANQQTVTFPVVTAQYFRILVTSTNTISKSTGSQYVEFSNLNVSFPKQ